MSHLSHLSSTCPKCILQLDPPENVKEVINNDLKEWSVELGIDISEFQESVEWDLMSVVGTKHVLSYPCCDYP